MSTQPATARSVQRAVFTRPELTKHRMEPPGISYQCRIGKHGRCFKLNCTCPVCDHPPVGKP